MAQFVFPALEFAPDMAVGQTQRPGPGRNRALRADGLQQVDQGVAHQGRAAVA